MNYTPYLIFLASLSSLNLIILALLRALDYAKVVSKQKILLIKMGLVMIVLAPLIFGLLRLFSWRALIITLPGQFINQLSTSKLAITLTEYPIHWSFYLFLIYGMGLFIMLSRIVASYLSARKQLTSSKRAIIQGQSVFLNEYIHGPLSFGLMKANMYFPLDIETKWTAREIQMSLAHEKIHVEQYDSLWKLLSLFVQAILFFAPWSYALHRRLELEMEIFCDEKTCLATEANIQEYGSLLLAMASVQPTNLIFSNMTDSTLKRRLVAMKSGKNSQRPFLLSLFCTALLLTVSTAIAMTSGVSEKTSMFKIATKLFIDGKLVSNPHVLAYANQKALIIITNTNNAGAQGLRMELVANDVATSSMKKAIGIHYDIQFKNGKEVIHSKPYVIVTPHQEGRIKFSSDSAHSLEMHVLAEKE
jgi:bla regulator protein blaR1